MPESSASPRWSGGLQLPYFHDVLDDVLVPISKCVDRYEELTCECAEYVLSGWSADMIGPDPGARGRRNTAQRAAALGNQTGTNRSKQRLETLIPLD